VLVGGSVFTQVQSRGVKVAEGVSWLTVQSVGLLSKSNEVMGVVTPLVVLTLHVGAKSPGPDREPNWLPSPNGHFSLYIRAYWGHERILDGSWKPPIIVPK